MSRMFTWQLRHSTRPDSLTDWPSLNDILGFDWLAHSRFRIQPPSRSPIPPVPRLPPASVDLSGTCRGPSRQHAKVNVWFNFVVCFLCILCMYLLQGTKMWMVFINHGEMRGGGKVSMCWIVLLLWRKGKCLVLFRFVVCFYAFCVCIYFRVPKCEWYL